MKTTSALFALGIILGAEVAYAVEAGSYVYTCRRSNRTYACGEGWTTIIDEEAAFYRRLEMAVYFIGPDYQVSRAAAKDIPIGSGWTGIFAEMRFEHCMHSGAHKSESIHEAIGRPGWATYRKEDLFTYNQPACDCGTDPF